MAANPARVRRNIALLALLALVLWFAWTVRAALNPLLLAFLFAYMLHPFVLTLERRGWSRKRAVNVIYGCAALFALLGSAGLLLQARTLWFDLVREDGLVPRLEQRLSLAVEQLEDWLPQVVQPPAPEAPAGQAPPSVVASVVAELREWIQSGAGLDAARKAGTAAAGGLWIFVRRVFGSLLTFLTMAFLVPVYTWFLLFELERIARFVGGYVPVGERERISRIAGQVAEVLGNFFRGRLLVCLLKGLVLAGLMAALGVPYAFLLGLLSGFLSLIPFAGPAIGYTAAALLALLEFPVLGALWRMGLVFAGGELIEAYVLLPRILGDSLGLHPLVVIVSLTVAASALGMFGLLLALPLTAAMVIMARELVLPAVKDWAEGRRLRSEPAAPG